MYLALIWCKIIQELNSLLELRIKSSQNSPKNWVSSVRQIVSEMFQCSRWTGLVFSRCRTCRNLLKLWWIKLQRSEIKLSICCKILIFLLENSEVEFDFVEEICTPSRQITLLKAPYYDSKQLWRWIVSRIFLKVPKNLKNSISNFPKI